MFTTIHTFKDFCQAIEKLRDLKMSVDVITEASIQVGIHIGQMSILLDPDGENAELKETNKQLRQEIAVLKRHHKKVMQILNGGME